MRQRHLIERKTCSRVAMIPVPWRSIAAASSESKRPRSSAASFTTGSTEAPRLQAPHRPVLWPFCAASDSGPPLSSHRPGWAAMTSSRAQLQSPPVATSENLIPEPCGSPATGSGLGRGIAMTSALGRPRPAGWARQGHGLVEQDLDCSRGFAGGRRLDHLGRGPGAGAGGGALCRAGGSGGGRGQRPPPHPARPSASTSLIPVLHPFLAGPLTTPPRRSCCWCLPAISPAPPPSGMGSSGP